MNLIQTLIMPLYGLATSLYLLTNQREKDFFQLHLRNNIKKFALLPQKYEYLVGEFFVR